MATYIHAHVLLVPSTLVLPEQSRLLLCCSVGRKLSAYGKQEGSSYQTAWRIWRMWRMWRMWRRGDLPAHHLPSGTVSVEAPPRRTPSGVSRW
jgi:hypothetical protein